LDGCTGAWFEQVKSVSTGTMLSTLANSFTHKLCFPFDALEFGILKPTPEIVINATPSGEINLNMPTLGTNGLVPDHIPSSRNATTYSHTQHTELTTGSNPSWEEIELQQSSSSTLDVPKQTFAYVHSTVYHTIEQWTITDNAKLHPFYSKWCQAKYLGLKSITEWPKLQRIMCNNNIEAYIAFVNQCPYINERYRITSYDNTDKLTLTVIHQLQPSDVQYHKNHLAHSYEQLM
jgi:hypothetical protein